MQRAFYWDDFRALIRRNAAPNAQITFYRDPKINPNNMAVFDRNRPRRTGNLNDPERLLGYTDEDHWRESHVCEAHYDNGMIPMESAQGGFDADGKFTKPIYRGALSTLDLLMREGCLRRTDELRRLFGTHRRPFPD